MTPRRYKFVVYGADGLIPAGMQLPDGRIVKSKDE